MQDMDGRTGELRLGYVSVGKSRGKRLAGLAGETAAGYRLAVGVHMVCWPVEVIWP